MPVINGIYTKDFPDIGRDVEGSDLLPIAESGNNVTYKTTVDDIVSAARVSTALIGLTDSGTGQSVFDMHYGLLRGKGMTSAETPSLTYTVTTGASLGGTVLVVSSNTGLAVNQLMAYLGTDGEYYTASIKSIVGTTITFNSPFESAIGTGDYLASFYHNESHPNVFGYRAIADWLVRKTKAQYKVVSTPALSTVVGTGSIAASAGNTLNNTGSANTPASTISTTTSASGVITPTFYVNETGAYNLTLVINSNAANVTVNWTYNSVTTSTTVNTNEPTSVNIPMWISEAGVKAITVSVLSTGALQADFIINNTIQVQKVTGLSPNLELKKIALFGDSWFIETGYVGGGIKTRLEVTLPNSEITNLGFGGDQASDLIARFSEVTAVSPQVVFVIVGTNDYYNGVTKEVFGANINQLKQLISGIGAHSIIATSSVGSADLSTTRFNLSRQYGWLVNTNEATTIGAFPGYLQTLGTVGQGEINYTSSLGLTSRAATGSVTDWSLNSASGSTIIENATGTINLKAYGDLQVVGSLGVTGTRVLKGWFTDLESTNPIAGSITGSAATLTNTRTIWGQNFNGSANVSGALTGVTGITTSGSYTQSGTSTNTFTGTSSVYTGQLSVSGGANVAAANSVVLTGGATPTIWALGADNSTMGALTLQVAKANYGSNIEALKISTAGALTAVNLAGTGDRMVQASSTGVLSASQIVTSGTYTPTLTNGTNVDSSSPAVSQYTRVGDIVTVFGNLVVDATVADTQTDVDISLPIASNIAATADLNGHGNIMRGSSNGGSAIIIGNVTDNRASFRTFSAGTTSDNYYYSFSYTIL